MRKVQAVLKELVEHTDPPRGCAIVLTESSGPFNWCARTGIMGLPHLSRFNEKVGELRRADPEVDWSGIQILVHGQRRVAHWMHSA